MELKYIVKVSTDMALLPLSQLTDAPTITTPLDNETIKVAYEEDLEEKEITIEWDYTGDFTSFELELSTDSKFPEAETILEGEITEKEVSIKASDLWVDRAIYIRVRAVKNLQRSPWSSVVQFLIDKEQYEDTVKNVKLIEADEEQVFPIAMIDGRKKSIVIRGPMKAHIPVNENDEPTELQDFLKNGDMWYDPEEE